MNDMRSRVLIIDENPVFRRGLVAVLNDYPDFVVTGDASRLEQVTDRQSQLSPHIIILDPLTQKTDGLEAIRLLRQTFPEARIVAIASLAEPEFVMKAIAAGAVGYLLKSSGLTEMIESLRVSARGDSVIYPLRARHAISACMPGIRSSVVESLSPRERQVLELLAQGARNKDIAARCYIGETTVKAHVRHILGKLDLKNRAQAAGIAADKGLLSKDLTTLPRTKITVS